MRFERLFLQSKAPGPWGSGSVTRDDLREKVQQMEIFAVFVSEPKSHPCFPSYAHPHSSKYDVSSMGDLDVTQSTA